MASYHAVPEAQVARYGPGLQGFAEPAECLTEPILPANLYSNIRKAMVVMSGRQQPKFEEGNRPAAISSPPRDSKHGRVVDEVGVFERGTGERNYWKVIQRIEDGSAVQIRTGYYAGADDDWDWCQDPVILPPEVYNDLQAMAVTEGVLNG